MPARAVPRRRPRAAAALPRLYLAAELVLGRYFYSGSIGR